MPEDRLEGLLVCICRMEEDEGQTIVGGVFGDVSDGVDVEGAGEGRRECVHGLHGGENGLCQPQIAKSVPIVRNALCKRICPGTDAGDIVA